MGARRASVWRFTDSSDAIHCIDLYDATTRAHTSGLVLQRDDYPDYFAALEQDRVVAADDARTDRRTRAFLESYLIPNDIHAMLDAPLRHKDDLIGVVCAEHAGAPRGSVYHHFPGGKDELALEATRYAGDFLAAGRAPVHHLSGGGETRVTLSAFRELRQLPGTAHPAVYEITFACPCGGEHIGLVSHDELDWAPLGLTLVIAIGLLAVLAWAWPEARRLALATAGALTSAFAPTSSTFPFRSTASPTGRRSPASRRVESSMSAAGSRSTERRWKRCPSTVHGAR